MTDNTDRIVQIIPGTGWRAHYRRPEGSTFSSPIVAWALLANGDVRALDVDQTGLTDYVDQLANFVRIEADKEERA